MSVVVDVAIWLCLLAGGFFVVVSGTGLVRLPDFYTRLHAAGITDTLGAGLIVLGLALEAGFSLISFKLFLLLGFLIFTGPTGTHALARAAVHSGLRPLLKRGGDEPSNS